MKKPLITAVSLREMYVQPGNYDAKFRVDPKRSQSVEIREIIVTDSDGKPMSADFRRWGTKLHISFTVDPNTPDGVALIDFNLVDGPRERFRIWVVK